MDDAQRLAWFVRHHESQYVGEAFGYDAPKTLEEIREFCDRVRAEYEEDEGLCGCCRGDADAGDT